MAKKKTVKKRSIKRSQVNKPEWVFDKHPNLMWLLPIFFIVAVVFLIVHHIGEERSDKATTTVQTTVDQNAKSLRF